MSKRTPLDDLISLSERLPWQASIVLAAISYFLFHQLALITLPPVTGVEALGQSVGWQAAKVAGTVLQYAAPLALCFGTVTSLVKARRGARHLDHIKLKPAQLQSLSWRQFEQLTAAMFREQGYIVEERGGSTADGGVDIVLRKGTEKYLVQCKHWRAQRVGVPVARELYGVMSAEGAIGGFIVTTGTFTTDTERFVSGRNITLLDGKMLKKHFGKSPTTSDQKAPVNAATSPSCPRCNQRMVMRTAKKGANIGEQFWGCASFPKCLGTRNV